MHAFLQQWPGSDTHLLTGPTIRHKKTLTLTTTGNLVCFVHLTYPTSICPKKRMVYPEEIHTNTQ